MGKHFITKKIRWASTKPYLELTIVSYKITKRLKKNTAIVYSLFIKQIFQRSLEHHLIFKIRNIKNTFDINLLENCAFPKNVSQFFLKYWNSALNFFRKLYRDMFHTYIMYSKCGTYGIPAYGVSMYQRRGVHFCVSQVNLFLMCHS